MEEGDYQEVVDLNEQRSNSAFELLVVGTECTYRGKFRTSIIFIGEVLLIIEELQIIHY